MNLTCHKILGRQLAVDLYVGNMRNHISHG